MDLSTHSELGELARLVQAISEAAPDEEWLLVGAMARDLLLNYAHDIQPARATTDVDFGIAVRDWDHFASIRQALLESGRFQSISGIDHRLRFEGRVDIDLVPFGGNERADGTIAWPRDDNPLMNVIGFSEGMKTAVRATLPGEQVVAVASLPVLLLLKFMAWRDRHDCRPGVDATDIMLLLSHYADCGNFERLYEEHQDLLESEEFDYVESGSILAGRDLKLLLKKHGSDKSRTVALLEELIRPQLESQLPGPLLRGVPAMDIETFQVLLAKFLEGLAWNPR